MTDGNNGRSRPTPFAEMPSHGRLHRLERYGRIVAGNGFALGGVVFATSAAALNFSPTLAGATTAGLFAVGGLIDSLQTMAPDIRAYRRRHHPALQGQPTERPQGVLERVLAIPGMGQVTMGLGASAAAMTALAAGAYQGAAGLGLFVLGHTAFAGAAISREIFARARSQALSSGSPTPARSRPERSRDRDTGPSLSALRAVARDPVAIGGVLFGLASATLNAGPSLPGVASAVLCAGGGLAQAIRKQTAATGPKADAKSWLARLRTGLSASAGYAAQTVGLAIATATVPLPALQAGLAGFTVAMGTFATVTAIRAAVPSRLTATLTAPEAVSLTARPSPERGKTHQEPDRPPRRTATARSGTPQPAARPGGPLRAPPRPLMVGVGTSPDNPAPPRPPSALHPALVRALQKHRGSER